MNDIIFLQILACCVIRNFIFGVRLIKWRPITAKIAVTIGISYIILILNIY
jgi:hypothetical protein